MWWCVVQRNLGHFYEFEVQSFLCDLRRQDRCWVICTGPDPTGVTEGVLVRERPVDHWEIMELVCATNVPTNARSCRPVCEVVHPNVTRVGGRGGAGTVDVPGGAAVGNVSINSRVGEALGRGKLLAQVSQVWPSR